MVMLAIGTMGCVGDVAKMCSDGIATAAVSFAGHASVVGTGIVVVVVVVVEVVVEVVVDGVVVDVVVPTMVVVVVGDVVVVVVVVEAYGRFAPAMAGCTRNNEPARRVATNA